MSALQVFMQLLHTPLVPTQPKEVELELQDSPNNTPRSSFSMNDPRLPSQLERFPQRSTSLSSTASAASSTSPSSHAAF